jgi:hypothetical protein
MPRFITNRWWTFILALTLGIGLTVVTVHTSHADSAASRVGSQDPTFNPDAPPPGSGDPDVPIGSAKSAQLGGLNSRVQPGTCSLRSEGDGQRLESALVWRLQVVLRLLKGLVLRS